MNDKSPPPKVDDIEMRPDAWERFERAVKTAARHEPMPQKPAKAKPQPRRSPAKRERPS